MYGYTQYDILVQLCPEALLQICYLEILFYSMFCYIWVFIFYMGIFRVWYYSVLHKMLCWSDAYKKNKYAYWTQNVLNVKNIKLVPLMI